MSTEIIVNYDGRRASIHGNIIEMGPLVAPIMDYLSKKNLELRVRVFPYALFEDIRNLEDADLSELNAAEFNLIYKVLKDGWADWSTRDMPDEKKVWFLKKYDELFGYMEEDIRFEK